MKPRHLPTKNNRTRDLREKKFGVKRYDFKTRIVNKIKQSLHKKREFEENKWD